MKLLHRLPLFGLRRTQFDAARPSYFFTKFLAVDAAKRVFGIAIYPYYNKNDDHVINVYCAELLYACNKTNESIQMRNRFTKCF